MMTLGRTEMTLAPAKRVLTFETAHTYSKRHLRRFLCGWCDQRLDRAVKPGFCGAIFQDQDFKCPWSAHAREAQ